MQTEEGQLPTSAQQSAPYAFTGSVVWVMQRRLLGLLGPHLATLEAELSHRQACCLVSVLGR